MPNFKDHSMQTIKDLLEVIYFLSELVVAYFVILALGNINKAKKHATVSVQPMKLNQFIKRD
jgi:hypothetical protein